MKKLLFLLFLLPIFAFGQTRPLVPLWQGDPTKDSIGYTIPPAVGIKYLGDTKIMLKISDSIIRYVTHKALKDTIKAHLAVPGNGISFAGDTVQLGQLTKTTHIVNNGFSYTIDNFYVNGIPFFGTNEIFATRYLPTGTTNEWDGSIFESRAQATGNSSATYQNITSIFGVDTLNTRNYTGTMKGYSTRLQHRGTGTLANAMGYEVQSPNVPLGTATTVYGLYIKPLKTTNVTNGRPIYQEGTADTSDFFGTFRVHKAAVNGNDAVNLTYYNAHLPTGISNALTVNSGGSGDASPFTFDGSVAKTISYNSIGATPTSRQIINGYAITGGHSFATDITIAADTSLLMPKANTKTLAQLQTSFNLKSNIASPTFTGTVTIPSGGVFGTPTSMTATNVTGLPLTTGVTGTLPVANGGTGNASYTAYALIAAGTTSTGAFQQVSGTGTSGYVLTSNGASALPTWQAASAGGTPGGSNTQIQFNNSGAFGASSNFVFNNNAVNLGTFFPAALGSLYFGDSITTGQLGSCGGATTADWVNLFSTYVGTIVNNNGVGGSAMEAGLSGTIAPAMVNRLTEIPTYSSAKYDYLVLAYGINDAEYGGDTTTYKTNYGTVLTNAITTKGWPAGKIILVSPYYQGNSTLNAQVLPFVTATQHVATTYSTLFYNSYSYMLANGGTSLLCASDFIHPTVAGYLVIEQGLVAAISPASGGILTTGLAYLGPTSVTGNINTTGSLYATGTGASYFTNGNLGLGTSSPDVFANYSTLTMKGSSGSEIDMYNGGSLVGNPYTLASDFYLYSPTGKVFLQTSGGNASLSTAGLFTANSFVASTAATGFVAGTVSMTSAGLVTTSNGAHINLFWTAFNNGTTHGQAIYAGGTANGMAISETASSKFFWGGTSDNNQPLLFNSLGVNTGTGNSYIGQAVLFGTLSAINSTATATVAQLGTGRITSTSASATTITLPTATAIATQLGSIGQGYTFPFYVDNSAGANAVTLILGSGMTGINNPTLTIPAGSTQRYDLYFTSTSACTVQAPNSTISILASTQTTLVAGTKALSITGVTTGSHAYINAVSQGGTVSTTFEYAVVCTSGTVTITALTTGNVTNTLDTSVVNVFVTN